MSRISPDDLLERYREAAIVYGAAAGETSPKNANRKVKQMNEIAQKLRSLGRENDLLQLLDDENQWVQLCAAGNVLEFAETAAMEKLRDLSATEDTWVSLTAQMTIVAWESGLRSWNAQAWKDEYRSWQAKFRSPTNQQTQEVDLPKAVEEVKQVLAKAKKIPRTVRFTEIQQFETMEDRFFAVDRTIGPIIGMNTDSVDFVPHDKRPTRDEILAWLWVVHPEYKAGIFELGSDKVRAAIQESEPE